MTATTTGRHPASCGNSSERLVLAHATVWQRLAIRLRSFWLDRALADGLSPEQSAVLSLRARVLVTQEHRDHLAGQLIGIVLHSRAARPTSTVAPCRVAVRDNQLALLDLAAHLRTPGRASVRGVARASILISDSSGPLYYPPAAPTLGAAIRAAREGLMPGS